VYGLAKVRVGHQQRAVLRQKSRAARVQADGLAGQASHQHRKDFPVND
jgi:hypothetical protein